MVYIYTNKHLWNVNFFVVVGFVHEWKLQRHLMWGEKRMCGCLTVSLSLSHTYMLVQSSAQSTIILRHISLYNKTSQMQSTPLWNAYKKCGRKLEYVQWHTTMTSWSTMHLRAFILGNPYIQHITPNELLNYCSLINHAWWWTQNMVCTGGQISSSNCRCLTAVNNPFLAVAAVYSPLFVQMPVLLMPTVPYSCKHHCCQRFLTCTNVTTCCC